MRRVVWLASCIGMGMAPLSHEEAIWAPRSGGVLPPLPIRFRGLHEAGQRLTDEQLGRRALAGVSWTYAGTLAGVAVQLVYTAVMGRLLSPADFGLLAMAAVVLRFGSYFAQMGVGSALVQKLEVTDRDVRAGVTSSLALGVGFAGLIVVAAPLAGQLFSPEVVPVVRVMALSFVFEGTRVVSRSLMRRRLRFRTLAGIDLASHAVSYLLVGIGLALMGAGVWSLVAAALAQTALSSALQYGKTRHPLRPLLAWAEMKALYSFGGRVSIIGFLEFLGSNLDVLAIGRYTGQSALGHYNRAFLLVNLPFERFMTAVSTVLFPAVSRIQDDRERVRRAYMSTVSFAAALLLPTAVGIAVASDELVAVVLGPQWDRTADVLPVLAMAAAVGFLTHFAAVVAEAMAALNRKLLIQACYLVVLGGGIGATAARDGSLVDYAAVVLAAQLVRHLAYLHLATDILDLSFRDHTGVYGGPLATGGAAGALIFAVTLALGAADPPDVVVLMCQIATGTVVWLVAFLFGPLAETRRALWVRLVAAGASSSDAKGIKRLLAVGFRSGR